MIVLPKLHEQLGTHSEYFTKVGAAGVDEAGDVPVEVGAGGDDVAIHGPVVVFAEGEAVAGMVVAGGGEGDEVGGVDEGDVVSGGEADAEAAGGALVIVDVEDEPAEGRGAAVFEGFFRYAEVGLLPMISALRGSDFFFISGHWRQFAVRSSRMR